MNDDPAREPSVKRKYPHPLEIVCIIGILYSLVLFLNSILITYTIPYGVDFGEGFLANMSMQMVSGENPYHALDQPPWIVSSYPPLYPFLTGLIMSITGPSLLPGRFIATISMIGILIVFFLVNRRLAVNITVSALMTGIFILYPWPVKWAQVVRVDTLGIFLVLLGIFVWVKNKGLWSGILTAILFSAAAFTKHSLLAAPAAIFIHSMIERDPRRFPFLVSFILFAAGGYFLANLITGGGLFLHLFTYTANKFYMERMFAGLGQYFCLTWMLHAFAFTGFMLKGTFSGDRKFLVWYYILAHGTILAFGFEGSDTNYYIEPLISTCFLAGFTINHLLANHKSESVSDAGFPSAKTMVYTILIALIIITRFINTDEYRVHRMKPEFLMEGMDLIRLTRSSPGPVLSEDASFPLLAGKEVVFQPYIMSLLNRTGKWDAEPFLETIRNMDYTLLILRVDLTDPYHTDVSYGAYEMAGFDRWTPEMEEAILENYRPYMEFDVGVGNLWYVYATPELVQEQLEQQLHETGHVH